MLYSDVCSKTKLLEEVLKQKKLTDNFILKADIILFCYGLASSQSLFEKLLVVA